MSSAQGAKDADQSEPQESRIEGRGEPDDAAAADRGEDVSKTDEARSGLKEPAAEARRSVLPMEHDMSDAPRIPRYDLKEEAGSGGMSVVYRAVDQTLEREVAVKVLHRHLAGRKEERRRFRGEAQAVARLRHPSILEIHDYSGQDAADAYIVSEFIKGPTLRQFAETVGMGLPEIGAMVAERLASALAHAHEEGVIHRDVKPENVMIQDDGTVKLTDFGIARMVDRDERMTQTGALLGSPAHMPPEIVAGENVDHRADVFSLGTVLYWLASGELPYSGSSPAEVLRRIVDSDYADPRALDPRVSDELAAIIRKAMARRPKDRYARAAELRDELAKYLDAHGFGRTEEELTAFFEDPAGYKRQQRDRLIELLMDRGRRAAARRDLAGAIAVFDRVLSLKPGHEGAKRAFEGLRRRRVRTKRLALGLAGLGTAAAASLAVVLLISWGQERAPNEREAHEATDGASAEVEGDRRDAEAARGPDTEDEEVASKTSSAEEDPTGSTPSAPSEGSGDEGSTRAVGLAGGSKTAQDSETGTARESLTEAEPSSRHRDAGAATPAAEAADPEPRPVRILLDTWAEIALDGERLERDREARRKLEPGSYDLSIEREGFVPIEEELVVAPGDQTLELRHRLVPRPATVRVFNDQRAAVSLDDELIGPASGEGFEVPVTFPERADGRFEYPIDAEIRIEKPGYVQQVHRLLLRPGQTEDLVVELEPEA